MKPLDNDLVTLKRGARMGSINGITDGDYVTAPRRVVSSDGKNVTLENGQSYPAEYFEVSNPMYRLRKGECVWLEDSLTEKTLTGTVEHVDYYYVKVMVDGRVVVFDKFSRVNIITDAMIPKMSYVREVIANTRLNVYERGVAQHLDMTYSEVLWISESTGEFETTSGMYDGHGDSVGHPSSPVVYCRPLGERGTPEWAEQMMLLGREVSNADIAPLGCLMLRGMVHTERGTVEHPNEWRETASENSKWFVHDRDSIRLARVGDTVLVVTKSSPVVGTVVGIGNSIEVRTLLYGDRCVFAGNGMSMSPYGEYRCICAVVNPAKTHLYLGDDGTISLQRVKEIHEAIEYAARQENWGNNEGM